MHFDEKRVHRGDEEHVRDTSGFAQQVGGGCVESIRCGKPPMGPSYPNHEYLQLRTRFANTRNDNPNTSDQMIYVFKSRIQYT